MGGPTRFPFGWGFGYQNQFLATADKSQNTALGSTVSVGTAGDITGQSTPNVTLGNIFFANNSAPVTITNLLLDDTANRLTQYDGKWVKLFFLDTGTNLANAGALLLAGTDNLAGQYASIDLMHYRGTWYEIDRAKPNRTEVSSVTLTAASSITIDGIRLALLSNTGSVVRPINTFNGGQVGQELTLAAVGSNLISILSGGNIIIMATNAFIMSASGVYKFIKVNSATWRALTVTTLGS